MARIDDFSISNKKNNHRQSLAIIGNHRQSLAIFGNLWQSLAIFGQSLAIKPIWAIKNSAFSPLIEAFYNILEDTLDKIHKKDVLIITGDWNAKVGSENTDWKRVMGRYGYGDRNERGERLLEFATTHSLYICNTKFEQKPQRKWTWASPDGVHKNMIDLILIQQRWKSSVINCRTFQSADICSDHSLVLCNIRLRLKKMYNKPHPNTTIDVTQLKDDIIRRCYGT
jgi:hypothetical protein